MINCSGHGTEEEESGGLRETTAPRDVPLAPKVTQKFSKVGNVEKSPGTLELEKPAQLTGPKDSLARR
jgi:hypothetical protein